MYVVAFNGPPRSGKDTAAAILARHLDSRTVFAVKEESLSLPLRHIAYAMVGLTYTPDTYEAFKTTHFEQFDRTGRQLMIDVSESFLKQCYGKRIMADMLIKRNEGFNGILLIRDCGFQEELEPICDAYGSNNLYVCQMHRGNLGFDGDSRDWVRHPQSRCMTQVYNREGFDSLQTEMIRVYGRLVNQMGWML